MVRAAEVLSVLLGLAMFLYGLWLIYPPTAFLAAGCLFMRAGAPNRGPVDSQSKAA